MELFGGLLGLIIWVIGLIMVIRDPGSTLHKILWVVIITITNCLGLIAYLLLGKLTHNLGR